MKPLLIIEHALITVEVCNNKQGRMPPPYYGFAMIISGMWLGFCRTSFTFFKVIFVNLSYITFLHSIEMSMVCHFVKALIFTPETSVIKSPRKPQ